MVYVRIINKLKLCYNYYFCLIASSKGTAAVLQRPSESGEQVEVGKLRPSDYFGKCFIYLKNLYKLLV